MKRQRWISAISMMLIFLFFAAGTSAAVDREPVGKVVAVRGNVLAVAPNGSSRPMVIREPVFEKDTLKTGTNGRIQLLFADQTIVSLGRNTDMEIAQYLWVPDQQTGKMTTRVKEGAFRIMGGAITRTSPENFITETPAATIGVRGSLYAGLVSVDRLSVLFQGGKGIDIVSEHGAVAITTPGFGTRVSIGKAPEKPDRYMLEDLQQIDSEFQGTDDAAATGEQPPQPALAPEGNKAESGPVENTVVSETLPAEKSETPVPAPGDTQDTAIQIGQTFEGVSSTQEVSNQATLTDSTVSTADTTTPPPATEPPQAVSGRYLNTLVVDDSWYGPVTATSVDGLVSGQSTTQDGTVFNISYQLPVYDPLASYTGSNRDSGLSRTLALRGLDRTFSTMEVQSASPGEFGYFTTLDFLSEGTMSFDFWEMGFAGIPSVAAVVPNDGVDVYRGEFLAAPFDLGTMTPMSGEIGPVKLLVNWHNNRVFGVIEDRDTMDKNVMFFFGEISGTDLVNVQGFSSGGDPTDTLVEWHEGIIDFGQIYGSHYQGFGVSGHGQSYDIADQAAAIDSWQMIASGFRDPVSLAGVAPTGTENWQGMIVGVAEDMTNPGLNRRLFMNHPFAATPTFFQFTLERDIPGTLSGSIDVQDLLDPSNVLKNITIGSNYGSVAIIDDILLARLGCSSGDCIETGVTPDTGPLKAHGNFLVANPDALESISSQIGWGYWEIAYDDPTTGKPYHLHVPYSKWVAGQKTVPAEVQGRIDSGFLGIYHGGAQGSLVRADGMVTELTNGITDMTVDFNPTATLPVSGSITFTEANLTVNGTMPVSSDGFQASISEVNIFSEASSQVAGSELNAFFYGANATSIGGNFMAKRVSGEELLGIIGGDLQP